MSDNSSMINSGILNPQILSLLARIRHTNALVIADRGFPFWPQIETVDISLVDDVPTVLQVIAAIRTNFNATQTFMAREFQKNNSAETQKRFAKALDGIPVKFEPHAEFKKRVPSAIGLIRTGDTIQYANTILISG
jgi:D-ribose pyranase